ncbi:MAG TPA: hypothetical protein VM260_09110, partial [Pirellula sp.]|nr:hypothetical protein [Pirellula sp.]
DEAYRSGGEWQLAPEKELRRVLESKLDLDSASVTDRTVLELELGKQAAVQVKQWVRENLELIPSLFAKRAVTEWNPYTGKALLLKLFALVGVIWLAYNNRVALVWLTGPLIINTILVVLTYSVGGRFLVPTYGQLYILSAFGFTGLLVMFSELRFYSVKPESKREPR